MNLKTSLLNDHITLTEEEAEQLRETTSQGYTVEIQPPQNGETPSTLGDFIQNITELQTKLLGLGNASPTTVFEIRRGTKLRLQFTVPTKRLERKLRTHLSNNIQRSGSTTGLQACQSLKKPQSEEDW